MDLVWIPGFYPPLSDAQDKVTAAVSGKNANICTVEIEKFCVFNNCVLFERLTGIILIS